MDESKSIKPSVIKLIFQLSILMALTGTIYAFATFLSGTVSTTRSWLALILYVADFGIVYFFLKKFRDRRLNGFISFGRAFSITFQAYILAGILFAPVNFLLLTKMFPSIIDKMLKATEQKMISQGMPDEQIEDAIKLTKTLYLNPVMNMLANVVAYLLLGAITGLIVAAVCKKESDEFLPDV